MADFPDRAGAIAAHSATNRPAVKWSPTYRAAPAPCGAPGARRGQSAADRPAGVSADMGGDATDRGKARGRQHRLGQALGDGPAAVDQDQPVAPARGEAEVVQRDPDPAPARPRPAARERGISVVARRRLGPSRPTSSPARTSAVTPSPTGEGPRRVLKASRLRAGALGHRRTGPEAFRVSELTKHRVALRPLSPQYHLMQPLVQRPRHRGDCCGKGAEEAAAGDAGQLVPAWRDPTAGGHPLVQEYGLAERAAEFVYGRLQDHPEGDSRHEHWRGFMEVVQRARMRKMERRHLMR
jgi:hypothetical protein